jgi:2-polyprenyl-6-methoxyphenol hydroxylase-like FAD-dependent oxidoreductase
MPTTSCDVLVVGAGPGGLATALSAARHGARVLVVERRPGTSTRPRATGINTRTMEILRTWGLARAVRRRAVVVDPDTATAATFVAPPRSTGRVGGYPSLRDVLRASPVLPLACPQDLVEPLLADAVRHHGGEIRFGARLASLRTGPDGGCAELISGHQLGTGQRVHARFVVGADGTRSAVRATLGIGVTHLGTWAEAVQVLFRPVPAGRLGDVPRMLTFVDEPQPAALTPMGLGRWAYVPLRFDGGRPAVPAEGWTPTLRAATGIPDLEIDVLDVQQITLAATVATSYRAGPGFLVGDAAHRTTPVGGVGLNHAVHDGHELGWKLAWVARGLAGDALLDSHDAERGPVGLAVATRSLDTADRPDDGLASDLGRTHRSSVIIHDNAETPPPARMDLAARPGERAPHVWVRHAGRQKSTVDLFDGRLTLVTGPDGAGWTHGVVPDVPLQVLVADRDLQGASLTRAYRLGPRSAVLVRPDGRVAWRHDGRCAQPGPVLAEAVATALGHGTVPAALAG